MRSFGVIPARYGSRRLPGKPLVDIAGKPMVVRVYERASKATSLEAVMVATDDARVADTCAAYGVPVVITGAHHCSGTDRVFEAAQPFKADIGVNIQGDEPLLEPDMIDQLVTSLQGQQLAVSSLYMPIENLDEYNDPNCVKVVLGADKRALYFSRSPIPFMKKDGVLPDDSYKHIGLYGYTAAALERFVGLPQSKLELQEGLEQLRLLEVGVPFIMSAAAHTLFAVDTDEDLARVRHIYSTLNNEA